MSDEKNSFEKTFDWISEKWYVWLSIIGLTVGGFKFYFQIQNVITHQSEWESNSQRNRDDNKIEMAQIKQDLAVAKNDIEWLKKGK
jgi:Mn2+/Fe2+ NRAMP family transporter